MDADRDWQRHVVANVVQVLPDRNDYMPILQALLAPPRPQKATPKKASIPIELRTEPTSSPDCGTMRGYRRHRSRGEQTCNKCRAALAAYYHSRKPGEYDSAAAAEAKARRKTCSPENCDEPAAYRRHWRRKEPACATAMAALLAYQMELRAAQRRAANRKGVIA